MKAWNYFRNVCVLWVAFTAVVVATPLGDRDTKPVVRRDVPVTWPDDQHYKCTVTYAKTILFEHCVKDPK